MVLVPVVLASVVLASGLSESLVSKPHAADETAGSGLGLAPARAMSLRAKHSLVRASSSVIEMRFRCKVREYPTSTRVAGG